MRSTGLWCGQPMEPRDSKKYCGNGCRNRHNTIKRQFIDALTSPDRWKFRSRFFPGIAAAMADQWGGVLEVQPGQPLTSRFVEVT